MHKDAVLVDLRPRREVIEHARIHLIGGLVGLARRLATRPRSAFQEFLDAALQLALFLFALAQPLRKVGAG